jgi:hypothetical protein
LVPPEVKLKEKFTRRPENIIKKQVFFLNEQKMNKTYKQHKEKKRKVTQIIKHKKTTKTTIFLKHINNEVIVSNHGIK